MITKNEFISILEENKNQISPLLMEKADVIRRENYGESVYLRGLIEFTNYCKNNCYYCGIRAGNKKAKRYRLTREEILSCCAAGNALGFQTFVLQGGEDPWFSDREICEIVWTIKSRYPTSAVTLSIGEKSRESYQAYHNAGADRYLLRHETATEDHYKKLHPENMLLQNRKKCLYTLKEIGFQVGAGCMVGSPGQTLAHLAEDLCFLQELQPQMVGIGPFLPHIDTPFGKEKAGSLSLTLTMVALTRILLPKVLLPSTTALGTLTPEGRKLGLKCGANVVMPNLSPPEHRKDYTLYNNKLCTGNEAAEAVQSLCEEIKMTGYLPDFSRGDSKMEKFI